MTVQELLSQLLHKSPNSLHKGNWGVPLQGTRVQAVLETKLKSWLLSTDSKKPPYQIWIPCPLIPLKQKAQNHFGEPRENTFLSNPRLKWGICPRPETHTHNGFQGSKVSTAQRRVKLVSTCRRPVTQDDRSSWVSQPLCLVDGKRLSCGQSGIPQSLCGWL